MTGSPLFAHALAVLNVALAAVIVSGCIYLRDYLIRQIEPYARRGAIPRWKAAIWPAACVALAALTLVQLALMSDTVPGVPVLRLGLALFFGAFLLTRHGLVASGSMPPLDCRRLARALRRSPSL